MAARAGRRHKPRLRRGRKPQGRVGGGNYRRKTRGETRWIRTPSQTEREAGEILRLGEGLQGFGFGIVSGDGFDKARDGEGIADAAGFADEAQDAAFAAERDGHAHQ